MSWLVINEWAPLLGWRLMLESECCPGLLVQAQFGRPLTSVASQSELVQRIRANPPDLPVGVSVRTTRAMLRKVVAVDETLLSEVECVVDHWPANAEEQLDALCAAIEIVQDPGSALSATSEGAPPDSIHGSYRLGDARSDSVAGPPPAEEERLRNLWLEGLRALARGCDDGMPAEVRRFLEDSQMYGAAPEGGCPFFREQQLRILAFLHFFRMGPPGSEGGVALRREIEWYHAHDERKA